MPKGRRAFPPSAAVTARRRPPRLLPIVLAVLALLTVGGIGPHARAQDGGSVSIAGFAAPESVLIDAERGVIYVANVNGAPDATDDNGFISRIRLDDMSIDTHWIDGAADDIVLNAPKGMALTAGGFLIVSDIDVLRAFLIETGEPSAVLRVADAGFLNDLSFAGETLYVTDTGSADAGGRLLSVDRDGTITVLSDDAALAGPNGVTVGGDGRPVVATMADGRLLTLGEDGAPDTLATLPTGGLDGLVPLADGGFLVSSWEGEAIYRVAPDGAVSTLVDGMPSPADIDVDEAIGLLAIPVMTEDRVIVMPLDLAAPGDAVATDDEAEAETDEEADEIGAEDTASPQ